MRAESEPIEVKPSTIFTICALVALSVVVTTMRAAIDGLRAELREHRRFLSMIESNTSATRAQQCCDHEREYFEREPSREVRLGGFKLPDSCPICAIEFLRDRDPVAASFRDGYFDGDADLGRVDVECHACGARVRAWWLGDRDRFRFAPMPWSVLPW